MLHLTGINVGLKLQVSIFLVKSLIAKVYIRPDPAKTTAIAEMKPPTNITELRRFLGMANQMGKFSSSLADFSLPLRELLSPKNAMSSTERNYAQIEKEALATTWACEKFHDYILGTKFQIESDHKPLIM